MSASELVPSVARFSSFALSQHLIHSRVLFTAKNWCPYNFDDQHYVCWKPTQNANFATETIEYEHYINPSYEEIIHQVENCKTRPGFYIHEKIEYFRYN